MSLHRLKAIRLGCMILAFFSIALSPLRAGAADTDVVFIIDGSGSISSSDWSTQRVGFATALQDPLLVPLDGSISVTVVQFSWVSSSFKTRLEFPFRVISTAADRDAAVAAVSGMSQIDNLTNPGDGINASTAALTGSARAGADQVYCMSTDGTTNSGANLGSAVAAAKAAPFVADKYSVIGIEDRGNGSSLASHYGPHVFGGGAFTLVSGAVEFANTVGSACLAAPVKLVGLEVTQVIQDLENKVKLVEKKKTMVRAYLEPDNGTDPVKTQARLHGRVGGVELSGSPLTPSNSSGFIEAKPGALARRNVLADSLNFVLPASWPTGTVEFELEGVGSSINCQEVAGPAANDCKTTVSFNSGSEFEVKLVKVKYKSGSSTIVPSNTDLNALQKRLLAIFPTAKIDRTSGTLDMGTGKPALDAVNSRLEFMRFMDFCWGILGCKRLYYGAYDQLSSGGGLANGIPGSVASGIIRDGNSYGRNRHAHELGHTMGRHHASNALLGFSPGGAKLGPCGSKSAAGAPDFPNIFSFSGTNRATIGPMLSGDSKLVFGWDSLRDQVVDPVQVFELMSYCGNYRWISDFTYEGIRSFINSNFSTVTTLGTGPLGVTMDYLVVRGVIDLDTDSATFDPFSTISSDQPPPQLPDGLYTLQMEDDAGNVLASVGFDPVVMDADSPGGDPGPTPDGGQTGLFIIPVEANPAIRVARVLKGGSELASLSASANAPTVTVVFPNGGEVLSPSATFTWNGNDLDGDTLSYTVQFSPDNGTSWQTLVADYPDTSLDVDVNQLQQTDQGLVKVLASDGFLTGQDVSDGVFTSPNSPPECDIESPVDGAVFVGVQRIDFSAFTHDVVDGTVADVTWVSDPSGALGSGADISKTADQLAEGVHQITMTCQDSAVPTPATVTDTVNIEVFRVAPPSGPAFILGDANNDGVVNRADRGIILRNIGNAADPAGDPMDVDGDGQITATDAWLLLQICTNPRCR